MQGVLLINNVYWKENSIQQKLINITESEHEHLPEASNCFEYRNR